MSFSNVQAKLQAKCDSRKAAEAAIELLKESVSGDAQHYWRIIREYAANQLPAELNASAPMTDKEVDKFNKEIVPYGKYKGHTVGNVPMNYLDWLVGERDEFKEQLKRYLQNESVRSQFIEDLDEEEEQK